MIKKTEKNRTPLFLSLAVVVAVGIAVGGWKYKEHSDVRNLAINTAQSQKAQGDAIKQQTNDNAANANDSTTITSPTSTSTTPTTSTGNSSTAAPTTKATPITVAITSLNQTTSTLQIRTQINGVTNTGTCTLTITQGTKVLTYKAAVSPLASSSTCEGFDVPLSSLTAGSATAQILFNDPTQNTTGSASQSTTIT